MSLKVKRIDENKVAIYLTRGDTADLVVEPIVKDHETGERYIYQPVDGDTVRFALKRDRLKADKSDFVDEEPLFTKDVPIDTMTLLIEPEDTKNLPFGNYVYDMELTFSDGAVDTFIEDSPFYLTREVH